MIESPDEALLRKAQAMAYGMGITVYIRPDGRIYQHGQPGDIQIIPPASSKPETAGRGGSLGSEGVSE
jgi:hypothetical protein